MGKPHTALRIGLLCVLVLFAGCSGAPTTTPTDTPRMSPLAAGLTINNTVDHSVHVSISDLDADGERVLDETYTDEEIVLDDAFQDRQSYRVTIGVNGTTQWNETVHYYQSYWLRVTQNGTVRIEGLAEV